MSIRICTYICVGNLWHQQIHDNNDQSKSLKLPEEYSKSNTREIHDKLNPVFPYNISRQNIPGWCIIADTLIFTYQIPLTHWGRVTHICVSELTIIGPDNGLSPSRCQAIIWIHAGIMVIWPLQANFSEILIEIRTFSFKKNVCESVVCEMAPFCLSHNVLKIF